MTTEVSEMDGAHDAVTVVDPIEMRGRSENQYNADMQAADLDAMTSEMLRQGKDVTTPLLPSSVHDAYVSFVAHFSAILC